MVEASFISEFVEYDIVQWIFSYLKIESLHGSGARVWKNLYRKTIRKLAKVKGKKF